MHSSTLRVLNDLRMGEKWKLKPFPVIGLTNFSSNLNVHFHAAKIDKFLSRKANYSLSKSTVNCSKESMGTACPTDSEKVKQLHFKLKWELESSWQCTTVGVAQEIFLCKDSLTQRKVQKRAQLIETRKPFCGRKRERVELAAAVTSELSPLW